ncbi:general secretion pathway protein GspM [Vibrio galatheae]|uniref:Type II secretion system protein M n=1 Tax=Vibrio galatheae TaxID=579748 RepID=A0A0F4NPU1_9VIBR|nr:type II secretion system protein M [Vibrio galatheae]KJY84101.1 general secretion pathway protein GspM [Vibrio galatheae]
MNKLINTLQTWWLSISQRERWLVLACTLLVVLGGIYWGIVAPISERADNAKMRIQSEKQLLSWVQSKADEISQYQGQGGRSVSNMPLNQAISSSVGRFKIELIRVQPRGEEFQVWVSPLPFNQLMNWIAFLQESHGIHVVFLDIDKDDQAGVVKVNRLQLSRG